MKNFTHYEKKLRPYEILGSERTPYKPIACEDVIVRTISYEYYENTKVVVNDNGILSEITTSDIKKVEDGYSYEFKLGSFLYDHNINYYFQNEKGKSEIFSFRVTKQTRLSINNSTVCQTNNNCCIEFSEGNIIKKIYLSFEKNNIMIGENECKNSSLESLDDNDTIKITNNKTDYYFVVNKRTFDISVYDNIHNVLIENLNIIVTHNEDKIEKVCYIYRSDCDGIYATGERFNGVNQKGMITDNMIFEQFTNQDKATYFPIPFYFTPNGYGFLTTTNTFIQYDFASSEEEMYKLDIDMDSKNAIANTYIFFGEPKEILGEYHRLLGMPQLPPEWSFGIWASSNRWNCQEHINEQIDIMKDLNYPATALVIEAWSDERTFYIFNEAQYDVSEESMSFRYDDFSFKKDGLWPNPKEMIKNLNDIGVHLLLWQIPVLTTISKFNDNDQHNVDVDIAVRNDLCVKEGDTVYELPDFWFKGSYLPDFTNPKTIKWWFEKRQYLIDIGVEGFKTDGGEFIYKDDLNFYNGNTGIEMKNQYSGDYISEYSDFVGKDCVLFSRASYLGNQKNPIHWAGDQMSTWEELRSVISAGLSMGLSGVPYWSFDIGGFAGDLPSSELYLRSTQVAVFSPVMQWHSEPMSGQFEKIYKRDSSIINDRSPWNIAKITKDQSVLEESLKYANLRINLLPYIYSQANIAASSGKPMMCHLLYNYPNDNNTYQIEDQFMLGDLLIAPILTESSTSRDVYLPSGNWLDMNSGKIITGQTNINVECSIDDVPFYLLEGCGVALNLSKDLKIYEPAPKDLADLDEISIMIFGEKGEYRYYDKSGESIILMWNKTGCNIVKNITLKNIVILSHSKFDVAEVKGKTLFNSVELNIYK